MRRREFFTLLVGGSSCLEFIYSLRVDRAADAITDLDYSAERSIRELLDDVVRRNVTMIFARVSPYLKDETDRHGITAAIGETRIFTTLHEAIAAARSGTLAGSDQAGSS